MKKEFEWNDHGVTLNIWDDYTNIISQSGENTSPSKYQYINEEC